MFFSGEIVPGIPFYCQFSMYPALICHTNKHNICLQMRCALARTASCSILSSSSLARRMQPTTTPAVTTQLAKRSLIWYLTASVSWLTNALVYRVSSSSTALAVAPALASRRCSWSVCQLTTARSQSSSSPSTLPHRCPLPLLSRTTRS